MSRAPASFAAIFVVAAISPASAAVRQCGAIVSSDVVQAASELEARKTAIDQWHNKVQKMGGGLDSWRLAAEKSLNCFSREEGIACAASGRPCIVDQAPKTPVKLPAAQDDGN